MAALASVLGAAPAGAHPHVFIDYAVTVVFDDRGPAAIRFLWTFDDMYSSMLFRDFTSRPTGALGAADIASLKKKAFDDTAKLNYFTDLSVNGKALSVKAVSDFTAGLEGGRISYGFTIPIPEGAPAGPGAFEVASFDHEFYISFQLVKQAPIAVEHGEKLAAACRKKTVTKDTSFFGPIDAIVVACAYGKAG
jgi:ABC-type uncharacterized transport system substrate-binding protein